MRWKAPIMTMLILSAVGLGIGGDATAAEPTDFIRSMTDRVIQILEDPQLQGPQNEQERQAQLQQISAQAFAWEEMARRALATHWRQRTPEEQQEFTQLFRNLVERVYMDRLEQAVSERQDILYLGEQVEGSRAVVRTKAIAKRGTEVPIDYRLTRVGDRWKIYDVLVEGISLVSNYRSQFNRIITTSSYDDLVQRMRSRKPEEAFGSPDHQGR